MGSHRHSGPWIGRARTSSGRPRRSIGDSPSPPVGCSRTLRSDGCSTVRACSLTLLFMLTRGNTCTRSPLYKKNLLTDPPPNTMSDGTYERAGSFTRGGSFAGADSSDPLHRRTASFTEANGRGRTRTSTSVNPPYPPSPVSGSCRCDEHGRLRGGVQEHADT